jgi:hypothetical protein
LFYAQQTDAHTLAQYIMENTHADLVSIITDYNKIHTLIIQVTEPINWLAFLHEFTNLEKNYILEVLTGSNASLKIVELF